MNNTHNIAFIAHGGGPLPIIGDEDHLGLVTELQAIARDLPEPEAIIVFSAHWESPVIAVTSQETPDLMFDYSGFPPETYQLQYPCNGHPSLSEAIVNTLQNDNISARLESRRGLDHGVFIPLLLMYPKANIPVVQVSLKANLSASDHLAIGHSLAKLPYENLLFLGSGFSFHNMRAFFEPHPRYETANTGFEQWLVETITNNTLDQREREQCLIDWEAAPFARICHLREEHLLPLHICAGLAGRAADEHRPVTTGRTRSSNFLWYV